MKGIQKTGLLIFLIGLGTFISLIFLGNYKLSSSIFDQFVKNKGINSELFINEMNQNVIEKSFSNSFQFSSKIISALKISNEIHKKNNEWDKVIWDKPHSFSYQIAKEAGTGLIKENKVLFWCLTFGLGILGALLYIIPNVVLLGPKGIKNNGIFLNPTTNRGWIGWLVFIFLIGFYLLLYFRPDYIINWTYIVDPISESISGNLASQWFLYGFLYSIVMTTMAIRMYIKYRHDKYQILRTTSVLFFQIVFAFFNPGDISAF